MKTIILSISMIFTSLGLFAQADMTQNKERKSADERATRATRMMTANLQLNHDQHAQIMPVLLDREKAKDAARDKFGENKEAKKTAMREANSNADAKLKTILTPDQYAKLLSLREEQKEKKKDRKTGDAKDQKLKTDDEEDFY